MPVPVMYVRYVRMLVCQRRVPVRVGVRLAGRIGGQVLVLMMFVVDMAMLVLEGGVRVQMGVPGTEEEHDARGHQCDGHDSCDRQRLAEERDRQGCAEEWSCGKVRCFARCAEIA